MGQGSLDGGAGEARGGGDLADGHRFDPPQNEDPAVTRAQAFQERAESPEEIARLDVGRARVSCVLCPQRQEQESAPTLTPEQLGFEHVVHQGSTEAARRRRGQAG